MVLEWYFESSESLLRMYLWRDVGSGRRTVAGDYLAAGLWSRLEELSTLVLE